MAYFDRFDICEAYLALEWDYNYGGRLQERPSNQRRREATHIQLHRMGFKSGANRNGFKSLEENGKEIYHQQVIKLNLPIPVCCECVPGEDHDEGCDHNCWDDYCENFETELLN